MECRCIRCVCACSNSCVWIRGCCLASEQQDRVAASSAAASISLMTAAAVNAARSVNHTDSLPCLTVINLLNISAEEYGLCFLNNSLYTNILPSCFLCSIEEETPGLFFLLSFKISKLQTYFQTPFLHVLPFLSFFSFFLSFFLFFLSFVSFFLSFFLSFFRDVG